MKMRVVLVNTDVLNFLAIQSIGLSISNINIGSQKSITEGGYRRSQSNRSTRISASNIARSLGTGADSSWASNSLGPSPMIRGGRVSSSRDDKRGSKSSIKEKEKEDETMTRSLSDSSIENYLTSEGLFM